MFTLGNKLNRMYSIHIPFMNDHCEISLAFNKSNSFIGFNLDQTNYIKSRKNEIHCKIYQDLSISAFATSFLDIRNFKSRNLDIKQQFHNILPEYQNQIHYETNETIKLSKIRTKKGEFESCLYLYVFRYTDFDDQFIYCVAERQHIDVILDKKIVRTSALQLCSNDKYEDLTLIIENVNRKYVKDSCDVDSAVSSVFNSRKDIKRDLEI